MYKLLIILGLIASILLILIVIIQNPKGGLATNFINANQLGGVAQTNKFLERTTWTLAIIILLLSILTTFTIPKQVVKEDQSAIYEYLQENAINSTPVIPQQPQQK